MQRTTASISRVHTSTSSAALADLITVLGREKLLYREQILEASKVIVGTSFSGPGCTCICSS